MRIHTRDIPEARTLRVQVRLNLSSFSHDFCGLALKMMQFVVWRAHRWHPWPGPLSAFIWSVAVCVAEYCSMLCRVLRGVAGCCRVLHSVAVCHQTNAPTTPVTRTPLHSHLGVCCSVSWVCVEVCCSVCCRVLQCVLQYIAVCYSVLQRVIRRAHRRHPWPRPISTPIWLCVAVCVAVWVGVCCNMLQCVLQSVVECCRMLLCCSALQCVVRREHRRHPGPGPLCTPIWLCVAVWDGVCVAVCCSVRCRVLQCVLRVLLCCSVMQCVIRQAHRRHPWPLPLSTLSWACVESVSWSVYCSMLQCVLQCVLQSVLQCVLQSATVCCFVLQRVAARHQRSAPTTPLTVTPLHSHLRVLQCVAVCCSSLQCCAVCCSVLQCVVQCIAFGCILCCSVLQCVAVCLVEILDSRHYWQAQLRLSLSIFFLSRSLGLSLAVLLTRCHAAIVCLSFSLRVRVSLSHNPVRTLFLSLPPSLPFTRPPPLPHSSFFVRPSVCLSVCLFVRPSVHPSLPPCLPPSLPPNLLTTHPGRDALSNCQYACVLQRWRLFASPACFLPHSPAPHQQLFGNQTYSQPHSYSPCASCQDHNVVNVSLWFSEHYGVLYYWFSSERKFGECWPVKIGQYFIQRMCHLADTLGFFGHGCDALSQETLHVYMYIYIYVYMYINMYIYIWIYICIYLFLHVCVLCMHADTLSCLEHWVWRPFAGNTVCIHVHIYLYIYIYIYICTCWYVYIYVYIFMCIYLYWHVCMYAGTLGSLGHVCDALS